MKKNIEIIYEDDQVVLVNKPSGVLSIPDRFRPYDLFNLYHWLEEKYGKIYTVHRLDRETSGLLIFAKTEGAHKSLSQQFEKRSVSKIYKVLVDGKVIEEEGTIDKPIGKHPTLSGKMVITKNGKPSLTLYKVVDRFKNYTLLDADIKTGRTHQVRVHFRSVGYPLAIDEKYGRKDAFFLSDVKLRKYRLGKGQEERPLMSRSSLHAHRLEFDHPTTGERLVFEAGLPKDFAAVLKQLGKWGR